MPSGGGEVDSKTMSSVTRSMVASRSWELRAAVKRSMRSRTGSSVCMRPSLQPLPRAGQDTPSGMDLARAIGADEHLDEELVASCATWFEPMEEAYRGAGAIAARPPVPGGADAQTVLLARFGRRA